ncbi:MAG: nucleotide sugar dehydrogenase [Xanthomonadales bacterium]|nr:UDP-N-acetyl-D-glucosamine 6-dehydrogenase [Xanthomonadales bacterium]MCC6593186.1 nucleotide sugar dehydrogenase [Xanthomonadales bacterium]MCE7930714.1 nucleotide sugar dehydrogenase [Xanthomonadales bacterium PRO6]
MNTLLPSESRPAVLGLGYVGLPLAIALGRIRPTIGFDIDAARIEQLRRHVDHSGECSPEEIAAAEHLRLSADLDELRAANVYIIAVPTPVNQHKWPDLTPLLRASETVGRVLKRGDVVVYESTVYPGATEQECVPVLERVSGLECNRDFSVGYSPERINPGDKARRLPDIVKVTSGSTPEAAAFIDALYRQIVPAGTHLAPSIQVAEAAKAIENTQRDVNIALVNEFAQLFGRLGIDTEAVLKAAGTKWNFLPFRPGLVGGHCIGVDPYYLVHKAQEVGYHPELILAARRINEGMSAYVTGEVLKLMARHRLNVVGARILVLGITFKENCADLRNTRVVEIVRALESYHAQVDVHDPWADPAECRREYRQALVSEPAPGQYDLVLLAVAHRQFAELGGVGVRAFLKPRGAVYDLKYVVDGAADGRL